MPYNPIRIGLYKEKNGNNGLDKLQESRKVTLEHMLNNHEHCSSYWCFMTRASVEGKKYNDKDDEFL